jgi:hypothetical protein
MMSTAEMMRFALLLTISVVAFGCPGSLDDPDRFIAGRNAPRCRLNLDVRADIFAMRCGSTNCHEGPEAVGLVDLTTSDGLAMRLLDVPSSCQNKPLVDTSSSGASYLLEKLDPAPACGQQMPIGQPLLNAQERECVHAFINTMIAGGSR